MPYLNSIRDSLRHYGNALHVYERLINIGLPKEFARALVKKYEKIVHPFLYGHLFCHKHIH